MTWFWGTCRSRSLSGRGRTPCAGSGGRKDGAPSQDSPASPWGCGLARDHFLNRSLSGKEEETLESRRVALLRFSFVAVTTNRRQITPKAPVEAGEIMEHAATTEQDCCTSKLPVHKK